VAIRLELLGCCLLVAPVLIDGGLSHSCSSGGCLFIGGGDADLPYIHLALVASGAVIVSYDSSLFLHHAYRVN